MKKAVIVLGHGSRRQEANLELEAIVGLLRARRPELIAEQAYVEFAEPTLEQCVARLAEQAVEDIVVVPLFLTVGNHLYRHIPERLAKLVQTYPQIRLSVTAHIGADPLVVQIIEKRLAQEASATELEIGTLAQVPGVIEQLKATLHRGQVPKETALDIRLALWEAVNNAVVHGNKLDETKHVSVCWTLAERTFQFSVADQGSGVAVEQRCPQDVTEENVMQENGKGLFLIQQIMDQVWYNEDGNQINGQISW